MLIRIILLACLLFIASTPVVRADTAIGTKWRPIALDQGSCMSYARMAIFQLGFYKADPGSQTMSGKKGEYTASIRCVSDSQLVFFIIAGPSPETVGTYLNILYSQFGL